MLAYPPVELRSQLDSETWGKVVSQWVLFLKENQQGTSDFLASYVCNADSNDSSQLRPLVFSLIQQGEMKNPSVETVWSLLELYGLTNVSKTVQIVRKIPGMVSKLRRLALHYLAEDHLNVVEPVAILLSDSKVSKEIVNDDWFRELHRIGGKTAERIEVMSQQALQVDKDKIDQVRELFPQLSTQRIRSMLKQHAGSVESLTMDLLENPSLSSPPSQESTSRRAPDSSAAPAPASASAPIPTNFSFGKAKPKKLGKADQSHLENTLRLLYESDEDERDDTYDDAEVMGDEAKTKTSAAVDKIEQYLWFNYHRDPELFEQKMRKTKVRQDMKKKVDWSDEQIEGWASMLRRQPKRKTILEDRYFGMRDNEVELLVQPAGPKGGEPHTKGKGKDKQPHEPHQATKGKGKDKDNDQKQQDSKPEPTSNQKRRNERNKARQGNHNRKAGFAKKMNA